MYIVFIARGYINILFHNIFIWSFFCRSIFEQTLWHVRFCGGQRTTRRREQCWSVGSQRRRYEQGRSCQGSCFHIDLLPAIHIGVNNGLSEQGKKGKKIGYINIIYRQHIIMFMIYISL